MHDFDFIAGAEFRASLEADDREMEVCFDNGAWKSVHVLAGSIVEALLVDYLAATSDPRRGGKDPLKLALADAISICKTEKVITERTADLSTVVRSYRNLIHPGRTVRTGEEQPSANSARIAVALVSLIVDDIAKVRRSRFGLTADQLLSKLERDSNALAILKHLLKDVTAENHERLLISLIPDRYFQLYAQEQAAFSDWEPDENAYKNRVHLRAAYKIILAASTPEVKERVAQRFVAVLREDDGDRVLEYGDAFFEAHTLELIPENHRPLVIEHLISRMAAAAPLTAELIEMLEGVECFITEENTISWLDPIIKTIVSTVPLRKKGKEAARDYLIRSANTVDATCATIVISRLKVWEKFYAARDNSVAADALAAARVGFELERPLPF